MSKVSCEAAESATGAALRMARAELLQKIEGFEWYGLIKRKECAIIMGLGLWR